MDKNCLILENLEKTFFYWKKIQLQVSKKSEFWFKILMGNRWFKILMGNRRFFGFKILMGNRQFKILMGNRRFFREQALFLTWTTSLARSVQKPCAPKPLERERGRGGRERERGDGLKEGEREREGERRERERGGESAEAGVRPTATPHTWTTTRSVVMSAWPPARPLKKVSLFFFLEIKFW